MILLYILKSYIVNQCISSSQHLAMTKSADARSADLARHLHPSYCVSDMHWATFRVCCSAMGSMQQERYWTSRVCSKFACKICLKIWDMSYDDMFHLLNLPPLRGRRRYLKLVAVFVFLHFPHGNFISQQPTYSSRRTSQLHTSQTQKRGTFQSERAVRPQRSEGVMYPQAPRVAMLRGYRASASNQFRPQNVIGWRAFQRIVTEQRGAHPLYQVS